MEIYTIGTGGHTANQFFETLRSAGVKRLIDVRLHNVSQLAGFTKKADLRYFLEELLGAEYAHDLSLAPTDELLKAYRQDQISWSEYATRFEELLESRAAEAGYLTSDFLISTAFLCSEPTAEKCHRRIVGEYFRRTLIPEAQLVHLR